MSGDHYFSARPASADERRLIQLRLRGRAFEAETASGTFSPDRLDPGTRILLDLVPDPPASGTALDLGCGWGALALALAGASPGLKVWAVDVNERALDLTRGNAHRAGLSSIRAVLPQDVPEDERFGVIWSNPPIRIGKPALHALLIEWLPRLENGGEAYLVVAKHLGADSLLRWLKTALPQLEVTRYGNAKTFRVLRALRR